MIRRLRPVFHLIAQIVENEIPTVGAHRDDGMALTIG